MIEQLEFLLKSEVWNGISGIIALLTAGSSILIFIKLRLGAAIKTNRKLIIIVILYLVGALGLQRLLAHPETQYLFVLIIWWFLFLVIVYVINQLTSYPELFVKGFQDDFRNSLQPQNWEYYGDWLVMPGTDGNILQVSNSDAGGISAKCKAWINYTFSFDTQIIKHNSSWIVRAIDVFSYVMLQCETDKLRVHYRLQGNWVVVEVSNLPFNIALRDWFHVEIEVKGVRLRAKITYQNKVYTVLDSTLLQPRVLPIVPVSNGRDGSITKLSWACSYPHGSVGFRQFGDETAHFKSVKVFKI